MKLTPNWRMMILGAGLVVAGFCLPWFSINLGERAMEAMNSIQQGMPGWSGNMPSIPTAVMEVRGGDIEHGLGWIILAAALGVAVMPLVWSSRGRNREGQRSVTLVGMLVGTVLLIYLLASGYREANVGVVLVTAGYAVLWVGAVREYVRPVRGQAGVFSEGAAA